MAAAYSDVSHYAGLTYWGPVSGARMDRILDLVAPAHDARVLDVGCGRAALLCGLAARARIRGVGVDRSAAALALARQDMARCAPDASVDWVCDDIEQHPFEPASFDVVAWIGGPYVGDNFPHTVSRLAQWLRPGGRLVIGHGFWAAPPPPAYLEATGIAATEFTDHWQNVVVGTDLGLTHLYACASNRDEWDHFEGTILCNVEQYAADHPDEPDPSGRLDQRRAWHEAQQRWGRDVMGFGLYVFRR